MKELEGLETCIWKHMSKDRDSSVHNAVTKEDNKHPLYRCKYMCTEGMNYKTCYKPLKDYPESEYHKAVMDDYVLVKQLLDRPTRKW